MKYISKSFEVDKWVFTADDGSFIKIEDGHPDLQKLMDEVDSNTAVEEAPSISVPTAQTTPPVPIVIPETVTAVNTPESTSEAPSQVSTATVEEFQPESLTPPIE